MSNDLQVKHDGRLLIMYWGFKERRQVSPGGILLGFLSVFTGWSLGGGGRTEREPEAGIIADGTTLKTLRLDELALSAHNRLRPKTVSMEHAARFAAIRNTRTWGYIVELQRTQGAATIVARGLSRGSATRVAELLNIHFELSRTERSATPPILDFPKLAQEPPAPPASAAHEARPLILPDAERPAEQDHPRN